jgi:flagellin
MIQTTEGYLAEVHDMLNRMVELSEKSANGTYETTTNATTGKADPNSGTYKNAGTDRNALQAEMDQLCAEVDRIAATANFNNVKLFNGDLSTKAYNSISGLNDSPTAGTFTPAAKGTGAGQSGQEGINVTAVAGELLNSNGVISGALSLGTATGETGAKTNTLTLTVDGTSYSGTINVTDAGNVVRGEQTAVTLTASEGNTVTISLDDAVTIEGSLTAGTVDGVLDVGQEAATATAQEAGAGLTLQIGETSNTADKLTVSVNRLHTDTLFQGITSYANGDGAQNVRLAINESNTVQGVKGYTIDISGQKKASAAAEALRSVINDVSTQRAALGAMQNRLDYTVNNLNTASENVTAANSRIRDTDMAKEMTKYTQMNVLAQAAQAMLAQANLQPQSVLQLLG